LKGKQVLFKLRWWRCLVVQLEDPTGWQNREVDVPNPGEVSTKRITKWITAPKLISLKTLPFHGGTS
jgi:hypothetical protein